MANILYYSGNWARGAKTFLPSHVSQNHKLYVEGVLQKLIQFNPLFRKGLFRSGS